MIDTIVFDIGNVLALWRWREQFKELGFNDIETEEIAKVTVHSPNWSLYDKSVKTDEEIIDIMSSEAPMYREQISKLFHNMDNICETFDYSRDWLKTYKDAGYRVYVLSNFARTSYNLAKRNFDFLQYTDGQVISYEIGEVKPERKIFSYLENTYHIKPENAIFIDDTLKNVMAAKEYGYNIVHFKDYNQADSDIKSIIEKSN